MRNKRESFALFFCISANLIEYEVKIQLNYIFILVIKDIHEVSTFMSKKYPFSCPCTIHQKGEINSHLSCVR
ncbi:hypothetical protein COJ38_24905 [Bacillus cereus]|nr:hypothetical protein CN521_26700 [Bacillus cereus]PFB41339.1 hypothetical protein CN413_23270 [Bacillus cereus]PFL84465.1 hypothetical protein COJ38_24905 [Bacillus cereus]PFN66949.1 hypothetical protein COJ64_26205 [Bacillus cereus]PFU71972.1 hypothetical protein COK94_23325 [Bacillus cereus]